MPSANPHAWVVFAAPLDHVTAYPERVERRGKRGVHKRADYDFSHQGAPLFEFWRPPRVTGPKKMEFLCVGDLPEYCDTGDRFKDIDVWYGTYIRRAIEDGKKWDTVRKAMEMGKCRIVIRWMEPDAEEGGDMTTARKRSLRGNAGVEGLKGKMASNSGETTGMLTRSQTRLRNGSGLGDLGHPALGACRVEKSKANSSLLKKKEA
jgi:hypothetical protein